MTLELIIPILVEARNNKKYPVSAPLTSAYTCEKMWQRRELESCVVSKEENSLKRKLFFEWKMPKNHWQIKGYVRLYCGAVLAVHFPRGCSRCDVAKSPLLFVARYVNCDMACFNSQYHKILRDNPCFSRYF